MRLTVALLVLGILGGCSKQKPVNIMPAPPSTPTSGQKESSEHPQGASFIAAPAGKTPAEFVIKTEIKMSKQRKQQLLVYVGATWCEPCTRFHKAVVAGELDSHFPSLRLLEFDLDRDNARLKTAGYQSQMIPLFAIPKDDGSASESFIQGAIKGDGAVAFIIPRLKKLLEQYTRLAN